MCDDDENQVIDKEKIKSAIRLWLPISITTYTLPRTMETYMQDVLSTFLTECHQDYMVSYLSYCLGELMVNAKKANTKRVYFAEKGLNINNEDDYNKGMSNFKLDTLNNIDHYLQLQKKEGLYVQLLLQEYGDKIKIEIHNNSDLTAFEHKRIHDKIARAQIYSSVEEVLDKILDDSEGAGLGIVIIILMLKKIGLTEENYQVISENGKTITRIILPTNKETNRAIQSLSDYYTESLDKIPIFQPKLTEVTKLLDSHKVSYPALSKKISKDVSLSYVALQYVNNVMKVPCLSLPKALELIGIDTLRQLYSAKNSAFRFISPLDDEDNIFEHSSRVAFYSYNLARNLAAEDSVSSEEIYIRGLLHDIGHVFFSTEHDDIIQKIYTKCAQDNIPVSIVSSLKEGMNHSYMGSKILEKNNFPGSIVSSVLHHHDPLYAPRSISKSVAIVYIADMMSRYNEGTVDFYQLETSILKQFNIATEDKFKKLATKAEKAFLATLKS